MASKKTSKKQPPKRSAAPVPSPLVHRIQALLHTMRCIAQYEDELCTLLHAAERIQVLDPALTEELRSLLEALPSQEYTEDVESLRAALPAISGNGHTGVRAGRRASGKTSRAAAKRTTGSSSRTRGKA